jgi:hypothetical protein
MPTKIRKRPKLAAAVLMGRRSVAARMKSLSPEERSEIARHAVTARWAKRKQA